MNSKVRLLVVLLCITGVCVLLRGHFWSLQLKKKKTCACEKCLQDDDPWFTRRFSKSIEPFLSANYSLPEEAFNWWKGLQAEGRSLSTYSNTVEKLFQMFPSRPDVVGSSPDRCRTCAVVGNSVNLKGSHHGPLIDIHDVIIRMNAGHTEGYEADVGTRTTHRIMYPESAMDLDNTTHLVLFPFKIQDLEWLMKAVTTGFFGVSYVPLKPNIKANKDLVMVVNPAFMRYVHDTWLNNRGAYPSTGFMALVLALHICDEVRVFGYGADKDGNWSHYWEQLKDKNFKTGIHPGHDEYGIIQELAEQQKLKFYPG